MNNLKNSAKTIVTKIFLILFVLLCFLGLYLHPAWFHRQYDKALGMYYVYKGDKAYKKMELQQAIDYYNHGLELYPGHYGAQFNLGNIYVVYEDYYSASDAYEKAIEYNKNFTLARMNLGIISAEKLGDFDGAINQYMAIIDSNRHLWFIPFVFSNKKSEKTNRGIAYYNMGVAYREKSLYTNDQQDEAREYLLKSLQAYKNAVRILKDDYDARYNLALTYHLMGDYQNAGANYCKAIEIKPMDYEAHYNLAILLKHLKMYKEAHSELEKAALLVSNYKSNSNTSTYVFDMLTSVSKILLENNENNYLVEKVDDEPSSTSAVTNVQGKIIATEALDKAMLKNFKNCEQKDFFTKKNE